MLPLLSTDDRLSVFARAFPKALRLVALPFLQIAFLRYFLHSGLNLRLGFANLTDYDLFLPGVIAYFIFVVLLEEAEPLSLRLQKRVLAANLIFFGAFIFLNYHFDRLAFFQPQTLVSVWFLLLALIVTTGFTSLLESKILKNPNRFAALPCLLIALSVVIYTNYIQAPWNPFANLLNLALLKIFPLLFDTGAVSMITPEGYLKIIHPLLTLRIGKGCGGMESLFFFSQLFFLYFMFRKTKFSRVQWLMNLSSGLVMMFSLNIFRIVFLFWGGIWLRAHFGIPLGTQILRNLFHTHTGWILYSAGSFAFFYALESLAVAYRESRQASPAKAQNPEVGREISSLGEPGLCLPSTVS